MKIAVLGAGGTGGYFGGMLARAGNDVTFIARGDHLQAMRQHGLTVKSAQGGEFTLPVNATERTTDVGPTDLVLVCIKTYDSATAFPQLPPLIGPETMVLSVQNGIDNERELAAAVGDAAVLGGLAYIVASIEAPGIVVQSALGQIIFGETAGGTSQRTERLLEVFHDAGISAEVHADVRVAIWEKFIGICAFAGMTSLTRLPIGPIFSHRETRDLYHATLEEVVALARAQNVTLPADAVDAYMTDMDHFAKAQPWASSSMHHDLKVGRRLELESLNGAASRMGKELGIPTPNNDVIYAALKPYVDGSPEIPVGP